MAKIIVIDDNIVFIRLIERFIEHTQHEIVGKALDGEKGVELYKNLKIKPDIVLLDYNMPVKNGLEASIEILEYDNSANILIVSCYPNLRPKFSDVNIKGFIDKTVSFQELFERVDKYISPNSFGSTKHSLQILRQLE